MNALKRFLRRAYRWMVCLYARMTDRTITLTSLNLSRFKAYDTIEISSSSGDMNEHIVYRVYRDEIYWTLVACESIDFTTLRQYIVADIRRLLTRSIP